MRWRPDLLYILMVILVVIVILLLVGVRIHIP
jgi:hypothetical protein